MRGIASSNHTRLWTRRVDLERKRRKKRDRNSLTLVSVSMQSLDRSAFSSFLFSRSFESFFLF